MTSVAAADLLLDGDFGPDAIASFVDRTAFPMSELRELRRELADRRKAPLINPLRNGETRPLVQGTPRGSGFDSFLDKVWAALLYSHSAAIFDPLEAEPYRRRQLPHARERAEALEALNALAIIKPLVDAGTLVLVPRDLLPDVKLDFRRVEAKLEGARAQIFATLKADPDSGQLGMRPRVSKYISELDMVAKTGWTVQIAPFASENLNSLSKYALAVLLKDGRRRLRSHHMKAAFLGRFDAFAIDTLTRVPVPDLSDLSVGDIRLLRDENAFGAWRRELATIMVEYERNLEGVALEAAGIACDRLASSAAEIERTIDASSALSAARAGIGNFAVAASAALASFPILSVDGRRDALGVAAGTSLIETGRRMIFCERNLVMAARRQHYRAAEAVFESIA